MKHFSFLWLVAGSLFASCSASTDVLDRLPETVPVKLAAPSDLQVEEGSVKSNALVVNWASEPQQDGSIAGYTVAYAVKEADAGWTEQACYAASHMLTGLEKLTTYRIRVRADSAHGESYDSDWSDAIEVTTLDVLEASVPENLKLVEEASTSSQLKVMWDEARNAGAYVVAYKTESEAEFRETIVETTECVLMGLAQNTTYRIKVKTVSRSGEEYDSDYCDAVTGTTLSRMAGIFNLTDFLDFVATIADGETDGGGWKNAEGVVGLNADLDFTDVAWSPIPEFSGTFDGNGRTISNLVYSSSVETAIGLFRTLSGTVRNLTLDASCSFTSTATSGTVHTGSFVGMLLDGALVDNCTNRAAVTGFTNTGGIVGVKLGKLAATVSNCRNYGTVLFPAESAPIADLYMGGIIAKAETNTVVSDCANYGAVTSEAPSGNKYNALGGIAGSFATSRMIRCSNDAAGSVNLSAASYSTGFVGGMTGRSYASSYESCTNSGAIRIGTASEGNRELKVGGIAGNSYGNNSVAIDFVGCRNTASIEAITCATSKSTYLGGIIGHVESNKGIVLSDCANDGDLSATAVGSSGIGGIVGWMAAATGASTAVGRESRIRSCTNSGAITSDVCNGKTPYFHCGGIAGAVSTIYTTIDGCTNSGLVSTRMLSRAVAGGIVGETQGAVTECVNRGDVHATRHNNSYCNLAGIAARVMKNTTLTACRNYGHIVYMGDKHSESGNFIGFGGIVAEFYGGTIRSCENYGTVLDNPSATASNAGNIGMIAALSAKSANTTIAECVVGGAIGDYDAAAADCGLSGATPLTAANFSAYIFGAEVKTTTVTGCTFGNE